MATKRAAKVAIEQSPAAKPATAPASKPAAAKPVAKKTTAKAKPSAAQVPDSTPAVANAPATNEGARSIKVAAPSMKKKHLLSRVLAATGGKKKDIKEIVEATLAVLGEALSNGEELNLPPFGKLKVNRQHDRAVGEMMTLKLRRGTGKPADPARQAKPKAAKQPLADAGE